MNDTAAIVCCAFLQKLPPDRQQTLMRYLPQEEAKRLKALPHPLGDPSKGFPRSEQTLYKIHDSWLAPFLRALPESDIRLFLPCLSPIQIKGLTHQLLFSNQLPRPSFFASEFLRKILLEKIVPSNLVPHSYLPESPLNALLDLDAEEAVQLAELLSMHDLAVEIRQIIDTVKLKRIHELLSLKQNTYLNTLSYRKEPVTFKKMGLSSWDGDPETFRQSLLQRGTNRIAKALYDHHSSLIWYVSHQWEIHHGHLLLKLCRPLDHPHAAVYLMRQVVALIEIIKNPNPRSL